MKRFVVAAALLAGFACGDPAEPAPPAVLGMAPALGIAGKVGATITEPVTVLIVGPDGALADTTVDFQAGGLSRITVDGIIDVFGNGSGKTDADGRVQAFVRLGDVPGTYFIRATLRGTSTRDSIAVVINP
jgi:hypothetical protein